MQQLLRLGEVGLEEESVLRVAEHLGRDGAVRPAGVPEEDAINGFLIGIGVAHRLPRLGRFQWSAHGHDLEGDLRAVAQIDVQRRVLLQLVDPFVVDAVAVHDVDVAGFDQLAHRRGLFDDADDDPLEVVPFPAAPVVLVPLQGDLLSRLERDQLPATGAGALGVELEPGIAEVTLLLVLHDDFGVDDLHAVGRGHGAQEERLWRAKIEDDRLRIGRLHLLRIGDEARDDVHRPTTHRQQPLVGGFHRRAVAGRAVMEGESWAELEGPDALVLVGLPALGHQPFELVGGAAHQTDQALVDVADDDGRAVVVLGLGIEVGRRGIETDDERRAIPFLAGHRRAHARRLDQTGQRGGQASRGGALDQAPPGQRRRSGSVTGIVRFRHVDSFVHVWPRATFRFAGNGRQGTHALHRCQLDAASASTPPRQSQAPARVNVSYTDRQ